jgi:hypothetical protein
MILVLTMRMAQGDDNGSNQKILQVWLWKMAALLRASISFGLSI